jgi:hypothetical protein
MSAYVPQPLNTAAVELPEELAPLLEKLAEHVHDCWAETRIAQGWTYGPLRDDIQRHHPCLQAYSELSEDEKELDRVTARETLKAISLLGFVIVSNS